MEEIQQILVTRVEDQRKSEAMLAEVESELMTNPNFKKFLQLQKDVNAKAAEVWKYVEEQMIKNNIKQLKGDFGTVSIAERQGWTYDEEQLPKKFFKRVVDTKKLTDTYRLEGKAPRGAEPYITKYITKRLK